MPPAMPNTPEMKEDENDGEADEGECGGGHASPAVYADRASAPSIMSTVFFSP